MPSSLRILSAAALTLLSASAFATTTVYTSASTFLAAVAPGAYFQNFDGLDDPAPGAAAFSGGGFSYTAFAPQDLYVGGGFLGTSQISEALTLTFTSGNVTAIGGNFFISDYNDNFQSVSVTLNLNDGTSVTWTPTTFADSYRAFTSDVAILSLTMSGPGPSLYASIDNLTVGAAAVPEPGTWALMGLGLAGLATLARRRNKA